MGHCELCGTEQEFPFECSHCGGTFCVEHRFPENHFCNARKDRLSNGTYTQETNPPAEEEQLKNPVTVSGKKSFSKIILLAFALVLVVSITSGFLLGTSLNYTSGRTDENSQDYIAGYTNGNSAGYLAGYAEGSSNGYATGCIDGNSSGYLDGYQKGLEDATTSAYIVRDHSYREMKSFLASDKTESNTYDEISYNCYDFASDVHNHATELGYRCGFVYIEFTEGAHAIVCFNTTDRGLIFIEPQYDLEVSLIRGKPITATFTESFSYYLIQDIVIDYGIIW
jgi:hypothetical protein